MSIWAFAVRRWQFTLVVFALLIALGIASFTSIARSEDPSFPFPAATITLVWPGANPAASRKPFSQIKRARWQAVHFR